MQPVSWFLFIFAERRHTGYMLWGKRPYFLSIVYRIARNLRYVVRRHATGFQRPSVRSGGLLQRDEFVLRKTRDFDIGQKGQHIQNFLCRMALRRVGLYNSMASRHGRGLEKLLINLFPLLRGRLQNLAGACVGGAYGTDELFGLFTVKAFLLNMFRHLMLQFWVGVQLFKVAGMFFGKLAGSRPIWARDHGLADLFGKGEQVKNIANGAFRQPQSPCHFTRGKVEGLFNLLDSARFFKRLEVFSLEVFDDLFGEAFLFGDLAHHTGKGFETG